MLCLRRNKVLSIEPILKSFSSKKAFKRSYQALRTCFKPYKALWSLKTWLENLEFSKPGGLPNINLFLYVSVQESTLHIHLIQLEPF
jgi:hypothetical protein